MIRLYERSKDLHHTLKNNPLRLLTEAMKDLSMNHDMFEKPPVAADGTNEEDVVNSTAHKLE